MIAFSFFGGCGDQQRLAAPAAGSDERSPNLIAS
jgi:hypothetical protein